MCGLQIRNSEKEMKYLKVQETYCVSEKARVSLFFFLLLVKKDLHDKWCAFRNPTIDWTHK